MSFEDFLSHMLGGNHEHPESQSSNPADYPRAAEITDTEHLMAIQAMQINTDRQTALSVKLRDLMEEMNLARAEREVMNVKFWRSIREAFPHVVVDQQCGMGYRQHEGKCYVVSWGGHEANNQPGGSGHG